MYHYLNYLTVYAVPVLCAYAIGKDPIWAAVVFAVCIFFHPLLDSLVRRFVKPLKTSGKSINLSNKYNFIIKLALPIQFTLVLYAYHNGVDSIGQTIISGLLIGLSGGVLIVTSSHELLHRATRSERIWGQVALHLINYSHFSLEHPYHHMMLGTRSDQDTAMKNEGVYQYLIRSFLEGYINIYRWNKAKTVRILAAQFFFNFIVLITFGKMGLLLFLIQGLTSIFLLKWINYVEHYGVKRNIINGTLEKVSTKHSWDCTSPLTNFSLFNLGFHSQHHAYANIPYYQLPAGPNSWNELPYSYTGMMVLSLVPKLYQRVMNPIVERTFY